MLLPDLSFRGRVIVIGDAAHACPPVIAQGAAQGAEDAVLLAEVRYVATYVLWQGETDDARCHDWVTDRRRELEPVTAGQYLGDSDLATRQVRFMADTNWACLRDIRALRDPNGLFAGYLAGPHGAANANHWGT